MRYHFISQLNGNYVSELMSNCLFVKEVVLNTFIAIDCISSIISSMSYCYYKTTKTVWSEEAAWESHDCFIFLISFKEGFGLYLKKQDKHKTKKNIPPRNLLVIKDKHVGAWLLSYTFVHIQTLFCLEQEVHQGLLRRALLRLPHPSAQYIWMWWSLGPNQDPGTGCGAS